MGHMDSAARQQHTAARRPLGRSAKLVLLALSMLVAVLVGEAAVRIAKPGFLGFRVPQIEHRPVAGLGFEMVPDQVGYSNAARVTINSAGFRGPEIRSASAAGKPRILALGDSMTYGVAVEDHETYAQQLEQMLAREWPASQPEVINAGVQRYFTFQEIDLLKAQVQTLRPDMVTLMVYINDLGVRPTGDYEVEYENERERAATAFRRRAPAIHLFLKNSALLELAKNTYLMWKGSRRSNPGIIANALEGRATPRDELKWQAVEQELVTFHELAQTHRFRPLVLFIPVRAQIQRDFPRSMYPHRLVEHCRGLGIPTIDPTDMFRESLRAGHDPFLEWDDHMSVTGHRLIAEAIVGEIGRDMSSHLNGASPAPVGR